MAILGHGSDLTLAPAIEPVVRAVGGKVAAAAQRLRDLGFQSVQLDATLAGIRPRDLDQRARRDLAATIARLSMRLSGVDLFIPQRHFTDPAHVDRAVTATLAAIGLAADLGKIPLSLALPVQDMTDDAKAALVEAADGHGVRLAVHAEAGDAGAALGQWVEHVDLPVLGAAVDPATALALGGDPVALVHRWGKRLTSARLSDGSNQERRVVGRGELDVTQYRIVVDMAARSRPGPVVLDLRGLSRPLDAAAAAAKAWEDAAFAI